MWELVQLQSVGQMFSLFQSCEICAFKEGQYSSNELSRTKFYLYCIADGFCQVPDTVKHVGQRSFLPPETLELINYWREAWEQPTGRETLIWSKILISQIPLAM